MSSKNTTVSRQLRVPFTDAERLNLGKELAEATQLHVQLEEDLSAVKQDFKSRMSAVDAKITSLSTSVANGYRIKETACEWLLDSPEVGTKQLVRMDTKEVIETLPMIDADKQKELPLADPDGGETVKTTVDSNPESGVVTVPADKE